ncbi:MAG: choice-of-anchor J domain-containing protein, partial [Muribaculaceae bacterium]|nr:choice-of-anchor J domain-containing protein [Muribaculaceae bacterium]
CMVELAWKAPEYDIDGNPINSVPVVYDILRSDRSVVATDIDDVSYRFQAVEKGASQRFVQYFVWAKTSAGGSSEAIGSNVIPVGVPYEMPFRESVSDCRPASIWGVEPLSVTGNGEWSFASDATAPYSQDSDNGYFLYSSKRTGDSARLSSGKIALTSDNPVVSFYYYAMPDYKNTLDLQVRVPGGEYTTLKTVTIGETGRREWIRVTVPLDEYRGKVIQLGLLGTTRSHTQIHVDNITVAQQWKVDMAATTIKAPASYRPGESKKVAVSVENLGEETVPVASVTLYRNGTVVGIGTVENISAGDARTVMFADQLAVSRDTRIEYYASVNCAGDMCRDNDRSSEVVSKLIIPDYPVVDDLGGSADGSAVRLSWCTPTLNGNPGPVTDTAEDYESFSTGLPDSEVDNDNVGGWTMVDVDGGSGTYGINNSQGGSYKYPNAGRPMAFMVFSYDDAAVGSVNWKGHDGSDKCFVAFADTDKQNDDWMISPLLTGDAQRVSFWARSLTVQYGNETFEFLVSSSGKDIADFVRLGTSRSVGAVWAEFKIDIPEGTRYLA